MNKDATRKNSFTAGLLMFACCLVWSGQAASDGHRATFELSLDITWSQETTPNGFPPDAHLSPFLGATHNARYVLFRDGDTASSGLELIAENGRDTILQAEFAEAKRRQRLGATFRGPPIKQAPGRVSVKFSTTRDHPLVSFVTMLAPSPDWFTGAAHVALTKDGKWIDETSLKLWVWDAGTDSGRTFDSDNLDTQPRQSVRLLSSLHFLTWKGLASIGSATIRRVKSQ